LSHPTLDGNDVKAMPGRFKYPILVLSIQYLKRKKIQVAKWGTPKKKDKLNLTFLDGALPYLPNYRIYNQNCLQMTTLGTPK